MLLVAVSSCALFGSLTCALQHAHAQADLAPEKVTISKAKVISIEKEATGTVEGTDAPASFQDIKVKILDGPQKGDTVDVENDYLQLKEGDTFYLRHAIGQYDGTDQYAVYDRYRLPQMLVITLIFIASVFIFGGWQGVRGLMSLAGSFLLIFYVLLPGILAGYPPLFVTVGVSALVIIVGSYITHGVTRTTTAAVIGMVLTVAITGTFAYWSVFFTQLSGLGSEEATYLNLNAHGSIDIIGLLLGGIIIGLLGVLYDAAIGQAVSVEELLHVAPHVPKRHIFRRALRIGHEHVGALVNTLAIAYVGASLPLLLLFKQVGSASFLQTINTELFATEIVRIIIGSIGLVLAVPITTFVAVWFLARNRHAVVVSDATLEHEEAELSEIEDGHLH